MTAKGPADAPRFLILLATFNGENHLDEQLASLAALDEERIDVLASDDGSTDRTADILSTAATGWTKGRFDIQAGPRAGAAENFRSLIRNAETGADYVAFCDQDDLWDPDKLGHALRNLGDVPASMPALYCGATRTMSETGQQTGTSPLMPRPPSFRNALVQSIAGGNTMVMNRAAFHLLQEASDKAPFVLHDWWSYIVISGAGGTIAYDPTPRVSYRQHGGNLIGTNTGFQARMRRVRQLLRGGWSDWIDTNLSALSEARELLTEENRRVLDEFVALRRDRNPLRRVRRLQALRIHRQQETGNMSMAIAALIGKL